MGISLSCPSFACYNDLESSFESIIINSLNLGGNEAKTLVRTISLKGRDPKSITMQATRPQIEESASFKAPSLEEKNTLIEYNDLKNIQTPVSNILEEEAIQSAPFTPKDEAAVKLQKVYKSFRTRRKLADCAVLVEKSWWKLLDFAELKQSSISFFEIEKNETAISKWSRARKRAAKVGKGLSQNEKARKLALQHWLEAIDPRHRYGHNLHFYYSNWLHSHSKEPFFYWLDIGEGREVNLDQCPRTKLQHQCIKYLGPMERKCYEVVVEDGKLLYQKNGQLLDTIDEPKGVKWIFVLSTSGTLYVGKKQKGTFQHSSFLAGGATVAAGRIVVENGFLQAVWPHSGHYRPTHENFEEFISFLRENDVDINNVKLDPVDEVEEEESRVKESNISNNESDEDLEEKSKSKTKESIINKLAGPKLASSDNFSRRLTHLEIPQKIWVNESDSSTYVDSFEITTCNDEQQEQQNGVIPEETILRRINSHKKRKSFQLGKHLSSKWSTGAGPRIGCLRDYPSGLQFHALEQVKLSPRNALKPFRAADGSRQVFTPIGFAGELASADCGPLERGKSVPKGVIHHNRVKSSPLCKVEIVAAKIEQDSLQ